MTDFVVSAVQEAAQRAIEQAEVIRLLLADLAAFALMVDAKNEAAPAAFSRHHGFIALPDSPLILFLPLATAAPML